MAGALLGAAWVGPAQANQRIHFRQIPQGQLADQVIKQWRADEKYAEHIKAHDMVPNFSLGQYDINGDGRPEAFALHNDELAGWCDTPELGEFNCLMVIYANTERGLIKIGEIPVVGPNMVVVGSRASKGVRDIIALQPDGSRKTYIWDGRGFAAE